MPTVSSKRRLTAGAALVVAALVTTTACGGGDGDGEGKGKGAGYNAALNKVANPSKKAGGTLRMVGKQDLDSADPQRAYYGMSWDFMRFYTRQLVSYDTKPGKAGTKLVPDLAEANGKISDGGKTYTYKLRDGVTWEDGSPLTSKDVKYGIERIWATDTITGGPQYLMKALDPKGEYKGPYKDSSKDKLGLKAIETPNDKTIIFKLPKPNGDFEQFLAMPSGSPVKAAKDTKAKYTQRPFSSGPYKFSQYKPGKKIILVRNDKWKKDSDPIRAALPDKVDVTISANLEENDKRLMAGDYDVDLNGTGMTQSGRVTAIQKHRDSIDNMHTSFVRYVALIHTAKPFDNVHCRKAVFYGTDFAALQQTRGGKLAAGDIANSTFPKAIPGYSDYDPYGVLERKGKPDPAKAKDELKKCNKPDGFSAKITARNNNPGEEDTAEALQAQLKKVGINLQLSTMPGATMLDTFRIVVPPSVATVIRFAAAFGERRPGPGRAPEQAPLCRQGAHADALRARGRYLPRGAAHRAHRRVAPLVAPAGVHIDHVAREDAAARHSLRLQHRLEMLGGHQLAGLHRPVAQRLAERLEVRFVELAKGRDEPDQVAQVLRRCLHL